MVCLVRLATGGPYLHTFRTLRPLKGELVEDREAGAAVIGRTYAAFIVAVMTSFDCFLVQCNAVRRKLGSTTGVLLSLTPFNP